MGRNEASVEVRCPAKINLFLRVVAKEESGYHQLETLFQAVDVADVVTVNRLEQGVMLKLAGPDLGDPESNTVVRAAKAFFAQTSIDGGASIELKKHIPAGTGLGGASSDAAGVLIALSALYNTPLDPSALLTLGGRIGADVPFFLTRHPLAMAWGRGDRLMPLDPLPPMDLVLVIPRERISTVAAFRDLAQSVELPAPSSAFSVGAFNSWRGIFPLQHNSFEGPVFDANPVFNAHLAALRDAGALMAQVTGSGSALFGLYPSNSSAKSAAAHLRGASGVEEVIVTRTLTAHPLNPIRVLR